MSIILETLRDDEHHRVWIGVDKAWLTSNMMDIYNVEQLQKISDSSGLPLAVIQNMTVIAFIKSDIANKDIMGYKKYRGVLQKEGYDV